MGPRSESPESDDGRREHVGGVVWGRRPSPFALRPLIVSHPRLQLLEPVLHENQISRAGLLARSDEDEPLIVGGDVVRRVEAAGLVVLDGELVQANS